MAYKVKLTARAEADAYAAYEYIGEFSPQSAEKWLRLLFLAIATLEEMPSRCPLIAEAQEIGRPFRQLLYGKRTQTYRIIFDIQEQSEEEVCVRVLRIWHGSQDKVISTDIDPDEPEDV